MAEKIAEYSFEEDAMGLGDFIQETVATLSNDEFVVYVEDDQGRAARKAYFERDTLTDGSTVVSLIIRFGY